MAKLISDGNTSFIGGMDTSRSPSLISKNQYVTSVNMQISRGKEGIQTREGFKCLRLLFDTEQQKEAFQNGNVQGIGNYFNTYYNSNVIVLSISGFIIELVRKFGNVYNVKFTNFRNNPNLKKCYISEVPQGVIISDGQSAPIYLFGNSRGRTIPSNKQIGPNHGGVYVQNRFWYINEEKKIVLGSTIQDPLSMEEAILANIYGFRIPDDIEELVAIGKQKTISRDVTGGNLAFSSTRTNYAVDVRGDRSRWGNQSGIGSVDNVINDVGAVSPFSYESANANIYFRNAAYGLMSTRSSQYQFTNNDSLSPVSIESSTVFDNDTSEFLDHCYTKFYKTKLFTTVGPQIKDGFVYWSGMLVMSPDIYFATKDRSEINRVESIYTGVRPYGMTVSKDRNGVDNMFIISYDHDGINRMYIIDDEVDYDTDKDGKIVEIESKIQTRLYNFGESITPKIAYEQFYSFDSNRDMFLEIYSRDSSKGFYRKTWSADHIIKNPGNSKCLFPFNATNPSNLQVIFSDDESEFYERQDLFVVKGPINLLKHIRVASPEVLDTTVNSNQSFVREKSKECNSPEKIYSYKIHDSEAVIKNETLYNLTYIESDLTMEKIRVKHILLKGEKGDTGLTGPVGPAGPYSFPVVPNTIQYFQNITGTTGGGSSKLDGINTSEFTVNNKVVLFIKPGPPQEPCYYTLVDNTGGLYVEDGDGIVLPDDNPNKAWIRI